MTSKEFKEWMTRNGLSLSDTAKELGITRRMVCYYAEGKYPLTKRVTLACKAIEQERNNLRCL